MESVLLQSVKIATDVMKQDNRGIPGFLTGNRKKLGWHLKTSPQAGFLLLSVSGSLFNGPRQERYRPVFCYKTKTKSVPGGRTMFWWHWLYKMSKHDISAPTFLVPYGTFVSVIINHQRIYWGSDGLLFLFTTSNILYLNVFVYKSDQTVALFKLGVISRFDTYFQYFFRLSGL